MKTEKTATPLVVGSTVGLGINTGDHVYHGPTQEEWVVACVDGDKLSPLGWPETIAKLADCTLLKKATPEDCAMWQQDLLRLPASDWRGSWARNNVMTNVELRDAAQAHRPSSNAGLDDATEG